MNDFEQLEKELGSCGPLEPSADFERRVEDALGDSGRLAVRQLPDLDCDNSSSFFRTKLFAMPALLLLGAAASLVLFFSFPVPSSSVSDVELGLPANKTADSMSSPESSSSTVSDDSPINGVSVEELSAMTEEGWRQPQEQEIPIRFFDEGIVERPGMSPARQYRYRYLDETIWVNPETNTLIRSSVPRQETLLIGLEPF